MRKLPILIAVLAVAVVALLSSVFIVDERQQALVLQFGEVKREIRGLLSTDAERTAAEEGGVALDGDTPKPDTVVETITYESGPGLYWKIPLIQDVVYYEDRILPLDTSPLEVTPIDDRRLVVDAFARWRISDPVLFRQAVQTEFAALPRLESILNAALREVLGSVPASAVLSEERNQLMERITEVARQEALALGVLIVDVRIKRADLPIENLEATYRRMNAEREREAADERARGQERAQVVRATAEREAVVLVSDAQRQAEEIRGQADAERNRIYAEAYGRDPEFFSFYRSLQAYGRALQGRNSTMVMAPDSEFFEYLRNDGGASAIEKARAAAALAAVNAAASPEASAPAAAVPEPALAPTSPTVEAAPGPAEATAPAAELESEPEAAAQPDEGAAMAGEAAAEAGSETADALAAEAAAAGVAPVEAAAQAADAVVAPQ